MVRVAKQLPTPNLAIKGQRVKEGGTVADLGEESGEPGPQGLDPSPKKGWVASPSNFYFGWPGLWALRRAQKNTQPEMKIKLVAFQAG